jgi:hypothetical protein
MKKAVMVSAILLLCSVSRAQEIAPAQASGPGQSVTPGPETRMRTLEQQVHTLAEEVALLREELKALRDAKSIDSVPENRVLLASAHVEPATVGGSSVAATPEVASQVPQTQVSGSAQPQTFGGATGNAKLLNPDISLIGDFIGTAGYNNVVPARSLELHESEIGFQAIIDPYSRADAFISFGETGVSVEEAYLTFTSLPAGLLMKVGKMRADFGKVNTIHNHALPWIDRPLVTNNLVGGEDGIDDAGISLSHFIPAPKGWFMEGTAQVYRGDSDDLFRAYRRQDLGTVGHLRAYRDLSESTNLDLGASYARGNSAGLATAGKPSAFFTNLYGADATLRWKPLRRAVYKNFLLRTELFWSARDQLSPLSIFQTQHAFGMYSSAEYRINRRWTVGGRFDRTGHATAANLTDTGLSGILTYWPSEFSQIRGQYRFGHLAVASPGDFSNANEFLFQFLFVMGAHGAHPF